MEEHLVFVYGTLMKGFGNHGLLRESIPLGVAETIEEYVLTALGIPFVTKAQEEDPSLTTIKGELYLVDDNTLGRLDALEGHPYAYKREKAEIKYNDSGAEMRSLAWMYFYPTQQGNPIKGGDYREYSENTHLWYDHYRRNGESL
tara:strand:+ start:2778 stop:3212 length:435 start_codon:yes stop_codon:yes gene_type:complete